jgi:raffinose/stachyose/melibiose transport system permease protein
VLILTVWQSVGFYMIIYIAGIIGIPKDVVEAAEIDGSRGIRHFLRITLPLIMPSVTVCIFTSLTGALKLFDVVLAFTKGGPGGSTATISWNIYQEAFSSYRYGVATAKSVVFFAAVLIITVIQLAFFKKREVEV